MDKKAFVIAIDGPVASGKGTVSAKLAHDLSGFYLATGAMYRAVALYCLENKIDIGDQDKVVAASAQSEIVMVDNVVLLNGEDITEKIKKQDVANAASVIALFPKVRAQLVLKQQETAKIAVAGGKIVVSEGRDTGTIVFPDSPFKVYLTATKETRAARRLGQYQENGQRVTLEEVMEEIVERDKRDTERVADPLPKNPEQLGYFVLDTTSLTEEQTLQALTSELERRSLINK